MRTLGTILDWISWTTWLSPVIESGKTKVSLHRLKPESTHPHTTSIYEMLRGHGFWEQQQQQQTQFTHKKKLLWPLLNHDNKIFTTHMQTFVVENKKSLPHSNSTKLIPLRNSLSPQLCSTHQNTTNHQNTPIKHPSHTNEIPFEKSLLRYWKGSTF